MNIRMISALLGPLLLCQCMQCYFDKVDTLATATTADGKLKCELGVGAHSFRLTLTNESDEEILVDKNGEHCIRLDFRSKSGCLIPSESVTDVWSGDEVISTVDEKVNLKNSPLKECFTPLAPGQSKTYTYCEGNRVYGFLYSPTCSIDGFMRRHRRSYSDDSAEYSKCVWKMPKFKDVEYASVSYYGYNNYCWSAEAEGQTFPENAYRYSFTFSFGPKKKNEQNTAFYEEFSDFFLRLKERQEQEKQELHAHANKKRH